MSRNVYPLKMGVGHGFIKHRVGMDTTRLGHPLNNQMNVYANLLHADLV